VWLQIITIFNIIISPLQSKAGHLQHLAISLDLRLLLLPAVLPSTILLTAYYNVWCGVGQDKKISSPLLFFHGFFNGTNPSLAPTNSHWASIADFDITIYIHFLTWVGLSLIGYVPDGGVCATRPRKGKIICRASVRSETAVQLWIVGTCIYTDRLCNLC
jgi:hypothetical protein